MMWLHVQPEPTIVTHPLLENTLEATENEGKTFQLLNETLPKWEQLRHTETSMCCCMEFCLCLLFTGM